VPDLWLLYLRLLKFSNEYSVSGFCVRESVALLESFRAVSNSTEFGELERSSALKTAKYV